GSAASRASAASQRRGRNGSGNMDLFYGTGGIGQPAQVGGQAVGDFDRHQLRQFIRVQRRQPRLQGRVARPRGLDQQQEFLVALDRALPAVDRTQPRHETDAGGQPFVDQTGRQPFGG